MLSHATAATPWGIEARPVRVEVDIRNGLPQMQIVGLPDAIWSQRRTGQDIAWRGGVKVWEM